jgi:hypothetical protein
LEKPHYMKVPTDCKPHKESPHLQNTKTIHPHKEEDKSQNSTPKCTWGVKYNRIKEAQIAKKKRFKKNKIIIHSLDLRVKTHPNPRKAPISEEEGKKEGLTNKPLPLVWSSFSPRILKTATLEPQRKTHTHTQKHTSHAQ